MSPAVLTMIVAGTATLVIGLATRWKALASATALGKIILCGQVFFAAPIVVFGIEHFFLARSMMPMIPRWIPFHLFWIYFVGVALIAAGIGLATRKLIRAAAIGLACLFGIFVVTMHIQAVVVHSHDPLYWVVLLRGLAFAGGPLALVATLSGRLSALRLTAVARIFLSVGLLYFGVQYLLQPATAPGLPMEKLTPGWVPASHLLAYLTAIILLAAGAALLINFKTRLAAASVGILMTAVTILLYLPILIMAAPAGQVEALNYVADTLMFGGTLLLLAEAAGTADTMQRA